MINEEIVERTIVKKITQPAPMTDELLSMIERFRGLDKEQMIAKFSKFAPGWIPYQQRVAKAAMLLHLRGEAPPPPVKVTPESELDVEITRFNILNRPKTKIELEIETELMKDSKLNQAKAIKAQLQNPSQVNPPDAVKEFVKNQQEGIVKNLEVIQDNPADVEEKNIQVVEPKDFAMAKPLKVDGRKKVKAKRDLIPEDLKK